MRVKMKIQPSGTRNGVPWPPVGDEMELPDKEGARMCANGYATPVKTTDSDVETRDDVAETAPETDDTAPDAMTTKSVDTPEETAEPKRRGPGRPRKTDGA